MSRQRAYEKYCQQAGAVAYDKDPEMYGRTVAGWVLEMLREKKAASTFKVSVSAVNNKYQLIHNVDVSSLPVLKKVLEVAGRVSAKPVSTPKKALTVDELRRIGARVLAESQEENRALMTRDWALMLTMYYGLLRRSEVVAVRAEDVSFRQLSWREKKEVMVVKINKSKTDNSNQKKGIAPGRKVEIIENEDKRICAVYWFKQYMPLRMKESSGKDDVVFSKMDEEGAMSKETPNHIVKRMVELIGLDPVAYGSHSMRRGGSTDAIRAGADPEDVRVQAGWAQGSATINRYVERSGTGAARALAGLGT